MVDPGARRAVLSLIEPARAVKLALTADYLVMGAGWARPAGRREVAAARRPPSCARPSCPFDLASRRDLRRIDELRVAGLIDPVDLALEEALVVENGPENA